MNAPESALVRCDCGWKVSGGVLLAAPVAVVLAPHVREMIRHWQDGHRLSCQAEIRYQVRDLLKRYRQVQRAQQRHGTDEDIVDMPRQPRGFGDGDWR